MDITKATVQELHLELIKRASFNNFDGEAVVASLLKHTDLWEAVIMTRLDFHELIVLRDMTTNSNNVCELYILTDDEHAQTLKDLAQTWNADEVDFEEHPDNRLGSYGSKVGKILRVWWD